jgi:N-acetylglucosaminyl-diphospho-decaprenol L-rhamnosyltransferase
LKVPEASFVSVVIPSWNTIDLTRSCLRSLSSADHGCKIETIVIDNGSADGSADMVADEFPNVHLIRNAKNEYYSKACNQGAQIANGELLCFLNSDTEVPKGSLMTMAAFLTANPGYGAVAPRLNNSDGSVQPICRRFPTLLEVLVDQFGFSGWKFADTYRDWAAMKDFDHLSSRDVDQPPGACLMLSKHLFHRLGGFDESLPLFYSDVDICRQIWKAGYQIRFLSEATVMHVGSASIVRHPLWRAEFMRNQTRYFGIHHGWWAALLVKLAIISSAGLTALRTAAGRRSFDEKKRTLRELMASVKIAVFRPNP